MNSVIIFDNKKIYLFGNYYNPEDYVEIFIILRKHISRENLKLFMEIYDITSEKFHPLIYPQAQFNIFVENKKYEKIENPKIRDSYKSMIEYNNKILEKIHPFKKYKELKVKTSEQKLDIDFKQNCWHMLQKYWLTPEYGPIVSALAFLGCKADIPFSALLKIWYDIYISIKNKNNPFEIFESLKKNCSYSVESYNFLLDFYSYGILNCAGGTYLFLSICKMYNPMNYKFFDVYTYEEGVYHQTILFANEKNDLNIYETTTQEILGQKEAMTSIENAKFVIYSEQLTAFLAVLHYSLDPEECLNNFFNLKVEIYDKPMYEILKMIKSLNRKICKTKLDSNSFDILILLNIYRNNSKLEKILLKINRKYILNDIKEVLINPVQSQEEIQKRSDIFLNEILKYIQQSK